MKEITYKILREDIISSVFEYERNYEKRPNTVSMTWDEYNVTVRYSERSYRGQGNPLDYGKYQGMAIVVTDDKLPRVFCAEFMK